MTPAEREQAILARADQVHMYAGRYARVTPVDHSDLVSVGWLGAIAAVDRFDGSRAQLATYADRKIKGAIQDYLRKVDPLSRRRRRELKAAGESGPVTVAIAAGKQDSDLGGLAVPDPAGLRFAGLVESRLTVEKLKRRTLLSSEHLLVLESVYHREMSGAAIAAETGKHPSRISQLKIEALKKMRAAAGGRPGGKHE